MGKRKRGKRGKRGGKKGGKKSVRLTSTTFNSSPNKFGSFILLALINKISPKTYEISREHSFISLSSESLLTSVTSEESGGWRWWSNGSYVVPLTELDEDELDEDELSELDEGYEGDEWYEGDEGDQVDQEDQLYEVDELDEEYEGDEGDEVDQLYEVDQEDQLYEDQLYEVNEDQLFKVDINSNDKLLVLKMDSLGVPLCYDPCDYFFKQMVGSCNGIVCLYDTDFNKVCLWNPTTKKSRILPQPIKIHSYCSRRLVAFGFDVKTKDYKVVLITGLKSMTYRQGPLISCHCRVQVYSLSTDSWRLLEGITCLSGDPFIYTGQVLCLNGSCFFMAHFFHTLPVPCLPESNRFIISFDFTTEIITPIQLPHHLRVQELYLTSLGDNKIALFIKSGNSKYEYYNIWELKENISSSSNSVDKTSWTKLHSFQVGITGEENIPRGISNDGKFALLETRDSTGLGKKMKLYHIVSEQLIRSFLSCSMLMSNANAYRPSRVSIKGGNGQQHQSQVEMGSSSRR